MNKFLLLLKLKAHKFDFSKYQNYYQITGKFGNRINFGWGSILVLIVPKFSVRFGICNFGSGTEPSPTLI